MNMQQGEVILNKKKPGKTPAVADDVILENVQRFNVFDQEGEILPLSNKIWEQIEKETTCFKNKLKIATVQSYLSRNHNGLCDDLRRIQNISKHQKEEDTFQESDEVSRPSLWIDKKGNAYPASNFTIHIPKEDSLKIKPSEVVYSDHRKYKKLEGPWTEIISKEIWHGKKMKCAWSFKRNRILDNSNNNYLTIQACCTDPKCGVPLTGICSHEPHFENGFTIDIFTYDVNDIDHTKKQQCRGQARLELANQIKNKKPGAIEEDLGAELMKSGDPEPALIRHKSSYGKMLEEIRASSIDLENLNDILKCIMTKVSFDNCIRSFSMSKFHLLYWTDDQLVLWRTAYACGIASISIDASGRFIKPINFEGIENPHVFLYVIVIRVRSTIAPLSQMLSARHDSLFIGNWLKKWLSCDIPLPKQVTTDMCLALQYGACEAINKMSYKEYVLHNLKVILGLTDKLAPCLLRMDIAHVMHASSRWKCFSNVIPIVKELYLKAIGFMSTLQNLDLFIQVLTAVFVISESKFIDKRVAQYKEWLIKKLETYSLEELKISIASQEETEKDQPNENVFDYEIGGEKIVTDMPEDISLFISSIYDSAISKKAVAGAKNCYQCLNFSDSMKNLAKHFTSWTAIMVPFYDYSDEVATSTGSENYFRFLRQVRKFSEPQSLILFYEQHLTSIVGRTNLTQARLNKILREAQEKEDSIASKVCSSSEFEGQSKRPVLLQNNIDKIAQRGVHVQAQPHLGIMHKILENSLTPGTVKPKGPVENAIFSGPIAIKGNKLFLRNSGIFDSLFELFVHAYKICSKFRDYVVKNKTNVNNLFLNALYDYCSTAKKDFSKQRGQILQNISDQKGDIINCPEDLNTLLVKLLYNVSNFVISFSCKSCDFSKIVNTFSVNCVDVNEKIICQDLYLEKDNFCPNCNKLLDQNNDVEGFFLLSVTEILILDKLEAHMTIYKKNYILIGAIGKFLEQNNYIAFSRHVKGNWSRHDSIDSKYKKHSLNTKVEVHLLLYIDIT